MKDIYGTERKSGNSQESELIAVYGLLNAITTVRVMTIAWKEGVKEGTSGGSRGKGDWEAKGKGGEKGKSGETDATKLPGSGLQSYFWGRPTHSPKTIVAGSWGGSGDRTRKGERL